MTCLWFRSSDLAPTGEQAKAFSVLAWSSDPAYGVACVPRLIPRSNQKKRTDIRRRPKLAVERPCDSFTSAEGPDAAASVPVLILPDSTHAKVGQRLQHEPHRLLETLAIRDCLFKVAAVSLRH